MEIHIQKLKKALRKIYISLRTNHWVTIYKNILSTIEKFAKIYKKIQPVLIVIHGDRVSL